MTRVLSCIQPTGEVHLGNYLGALRNWVDGQYEKDVFHGIVESGSVASAIPHTITAIQIAIMKNHLINLMNQVINQMSRIQMILTVIQMKNQRIIQMSQVTT